MKNRPQEATAYPQGGADLPREIQTLLIRDTKSAQRDRDLPGEDNCLPSISASTVEAAEGFWQSRPKTGSFHGRRGEITLSPAF